MLPSLKNKFSMPEVISSGSMYPPAEDLLWCITPKLPGSNIRCITVLLLNFGVEDFTSHNVDSFFTKQAEGFRDSNRRNTVARGVADILHGVDICWLLKREMLARVEELSNWR